MAAKKEGAPARLRVQKTLKLYVGGAFVRSESGRTLPVTSSRGEVMHVSQGSRKDLRDAMRTARKAQGGWAAKTAYNRGQILYRLAEMLEDRASVLPTSEADATAAVERAVFHAGWCDKITALLSTLNPVQQAFVNYSMIRPLGVVMAVPDPKDGLLGLVEATCDALVMGNSVIVLVPVETAELATSFAEALATSDVPGGVVNVITGDLPELLGAANALEDLDAIVAKRDVLGEKLATDVETKGAHVMRRLWWTRGAATPAEPWELQKLCEVKTVWMSSGADITGGAGY
jgi:acyl-CoA reductase-like NAD-dependent aldehyde dehydrogenase